MKPKLSLIHEESSSSEESDISDDDHFERDEAGRVKIFENLDEDQLYKWFSEKSLKRQLPILLRTLKEAMFQEEESAVKVDFVKKVFAEQVQKTKH